MDDLQGILQYIGNFFLVWAAIVGTASVIVHSRVFVRSSRMSVHLLVYMVAIAAVLDLGVVKLVIGDSGSFQLLRLVTFISVPLVMTQRLYLQLVAQRAARGNADPPPPDTSDRPGHLVD